MANNFFLKKKNMLDIINAIKYRGIITKPEIVKITGLTPATVHNSMNDLLSRKIVIEDGNADSTGGRKAFIYKFNSKIFYIIGVDVGDVRISVGIYDFDINLVYKIEKEYVLRDYSVEEGIETIISLIQKIISESKIKRDKILGIGVSVSGPVNFEKGKIYQITRAPKWKNVPLATIIQDRLNYHTIVDKDNNSAIAYFKMIDVSRDNKNVVLLSTQKGIGTSLLINGAIYRGKQSLAGELGHIRVESSGEECYCGKIGCIEPLASDPSIAQFARKRLKEGAASLIKDLCGGKLENITLDTVVTAAKRQDALAKELLMNAAHYLSICIGNIIKIYDPDEIIFDCIWLKEFNDIFNYIMDKVYEDNEFINRDRLKIILNKEENFILSGAATLIIEYHLKSFEFSKLLS